MCAGERGKEKKKNSGEGGGEMICMLGLLDRFHGTVVLHRFRQRGRSRVTDVVAVDTARIANETQKERCQGIVLDQKERMCAGERGKGKKKNSGDGRKGGER